MGRHTSAGRLLIGLTIAAVLGGCAAAASSPPAATAAKPASPPPAASAPALTPTVAPSEAGSQPTAVACGPVAVVSGTENCYITEGTVTTDADGRSHSRGGTVQCTDIVNDARVTGAVTGTWASDRWGTESSGALVQWGVLRLENEEGAWEGRYTGVYSSDRGDTIVFWWTGTGGYAGLTYFELVTGSGPWVLQGQIFPGTPPAP